MIPNIATQPELIARGGANGADWAFDVEYVDPDGVAIDCTGCTVSGEIRWSGGAVPLTTGNGRVTATDLANGQWAYRLGRDEPDQARVPAGLAASLIVWIEDTLGRSLPLAAIPLKVIDL